MTLIGRHFMINKCCNCVLFNKSNAERVSARSKDVRGPGHLMRVYTKIIPFKGIISADLQWLLGLSTDYGRPSDSTCYSTDLNCG